MLAQQIETSPAIDRQKWLELRRQGIGGSDLAAICGLNRWKSPMDIWLEKTGQAQPDEESEAAYWGTLMEPILREEFLKRTGLEVIIENRTRWHSDHSFMLANLDGIVIHPDFGPCVFEAKTANAYLSREWSDSIPEGYILQVQHYLAVTGYSLAFVAALIGGNNFVIRTIQRDEAMIAEIIEIEARFWWHVENNTPPDFDGSDASARILAQLYPDSKDATIILPSEALDLIREYQEAKEDMERAETGKNLAANRLKNLLQDSAVGLAGEYKVSWRTVHTERFDSKGFKSEHPDLYKQYSKESSYRRFQIA